MSASKHLAGESNLWTVGHRQPRMVVNTTAQHKIINLLGARDTFVTTCCNVFNVWPKTTLLLPVWCRETKSLDTPEERAVAILLFLLVTAVKPAFQQDPRWRVRQLLLQPVGKVTVTLDIRSLAGTRG